MTRKVLELLSEAVEEAEDARRWYARRNAELALDFDDALGEAFHEIKEAPETWPPYVHGTRRFLLRRFPYAVVYLAHGEILYVVAIAHQSRRPGYWRERLDR